MADDFLVAPELGELYDLFDRPLIDLGAPMGRDNFATRAPSSRQFWLSLGFDYMAIDLVGDAFRLDLNDDLVPLSMRNRFDIVVNAGTTEHVANQENAFRVIHALVRPGGIMLHELPCQGMLTHGLINYSPKFFWHLCRENCYEVMWLTVSYDGASAVPQDVIESNEEARRRFSGKPYVQLTKGVVPDILRTIAPETIAYLHIDMSSAAPEIGALTLLFDRVSPAGEIILDDYGWILHRKQKEADDRFMSARGYDILELPTGQGLLIKR